MIRAGRTAVDTRGLAKIHGITLGTLLNNRTYDQPDHPRPINARGRGRLWDAAQARAYAAGKPIPPLPDHDHPDDLLDDYEAAALAHLSPATLRKAAADRRIPGQPRIICGIRHWPRHTIETYRDRPRGEPGRPVGAKDTQPRNRRPDPRRERASQFLDEAHRTHTRVTARELAARFDISLRTAERWLADHRRRTSEVIR